MEREGKPSIRTQVEVEDGKIVALQPDPECREMKRMVADLNRRVIRVQTHGMAAWERKAEKGRPRGFGVEVAREVTEEEEAAGAGGSAPFYTAAEEPAQQEDTALVQQYLEDVAEIEGKPGPVKKTVRRWVYGKPAAGHADSCCCRQIDAVAGKMTIAEASGMFDEGVDRLLVNIYFNPPPKRGVGSKVLRRASEVSKRLSERMKSVARRISHRHNEPHLEKSGSQRKDVEEVTGVEGETVQLRKSRKQTQSPSDAGDEHAREAGSASGSHTQRKTDLEQEHTESGSETAPREVRESSDEEQFHSARSSLASGEERAGSSQDKGNLQSGHNFGVYQVLLESDEEDNDNESVPHYQRPQQTSFAPQLINRNSNGRKENLQEDRSLSGDLNELPHCEHHKSITEDDQDIKKLQVDKAKAELNSEKDKPHCECSDCSKCENEKSKSPDRDTLNSKGTGTGTCETHFKEAQGEQRIEGTELKPDLQLPVSDQQQNPRRIVGSLDLFILNDTAEFEWEPLPERSEEEVLVSQPIGGLELEEDFSQNIRDGEEVTAEPEHLQENIQNDENGTRSTSTVNGGRRTI